MTRPVLHDYYRSSAAYRVRIALNLKGVEYEQPSGQSARERAEIDDYRALNPQGLVPMLEIDGHRLTQSLAIINYLDSRFPSPPLLPARAAERGACASRWRWRSPATSTRSTICACSNI